MCSLFIPLTLPTSIAHALYEKPLPCPYPGHNIRLPLAICCKTHYITSGVCLYVGKLFALLQKYVPNHGSVSLTWQTYYRVSLPCLLLNYPRPFWPFVRQDNMQTVSTIYFWAGIFIYMYSGVFSCLLWGVLPLQRWVSSIIDQHYSRYWAPLVPLLASPTLCISPG